MENLPGPATPEGVPLDVMEGVFFGGADLQGLVGALVEDPAGGESVRAGLEEGWGGLFGFFAHFRLAVVNVRGKVKF